jgi:uncharacterized protein YndB with AHSA1/START domain
LSYGPDRRDICWEGEYLEIIEPERLAFTIRGLHPDHVGGVVTAILTDLGDGRTEICSSTNRASEPRSSGSVRGDPGRPNSTASPSACPTPD